MKYAIQTLTSVVMKKFKFVQNSFTGHTSEKTRSLIYCYKNHERPSLPTTREDTWGSRNLISVIKQNEKTLHQRICTFIYNVRVFTHPYCYYVIFSFSRQRDRPGKTRNDRSITKIS